MVLLYAGVFGLYILILTLSCPNRPNLSCLEKCLFTQVETVPQPLVFLIDSTPLIVYIRIMPSLQSYSVRGNRYWRIVESFRDKGGRPRIRVVRHLGTAQKLLERLSEAPGRPLYAAERDFGATAALWDTAQQLDIVRTIDAHARKRKQGPSVGEYILLAALNRALAPASKRKLAAWYRNTILVRLLPLRPAALRSQRFWDHMSYLDASTLVRIENDITRRLVEEWKVDLQTLFYDTTNFDTFLSSENPARLARRGHAKSKRNDLRIVAWRCWSPGIFISRCSRRSTKGIRTTRSPSAEFWTIWSLATECSERNVTASPWFSIRGTIRRKTFSISKGLPTTSLALWSPLNTRIF